MKGENKGESKDKYPVRPSYLSLEVRRRRLMDLKAKTECRACGRTNHWVSDRGCAMSSATSSYAPSVIRTARMTVHERHLPRTRNAHTCFVLADDGEDGDPSNAFTALPALFRRTPLTPIMDDDDKKFSTGGHRDMQCGIVLKDKTRQCLSKKQIVCPHRPHDLYG